MQHVDSQSCGVTAHAVAGAEPRRAATQPRLQSRLDALLQDGVDAAGAEALLSELAAQGECEAMIAVWDGLKAQRIVPSKAAWAALERLHSRGKGRIPRGTLVVRSATSGSRALAPGRRLHKIMKGRRVSARSDAALPFMGPAVAWVAAERAQGRQLRCGKGAKARISLAKRLLADLSLPSLEVARAVVTKLKQKKLLPQ